MEKIEFIKKALLKDLPYFEVVQYWNDYCVDQSCEYGIYTDLDEMAEMLDGTPAEFARRIYCGDVSSWHDDYFTLNGYANIVSFNSLDDKNSPIDFDNLSEWLVEHSYEYQDIQGLIEDWEDLQEEEEEEEEED